MTRSTQILSKSYSFAAICALALTVSLSLPSLCKAQANKNASSSVGSAEATSTVKEAAAQGFQLSTSTNVSDQASVEAVMLPASVSRKIFGKEVGNNYAVIELVIANRSADAALIVHSIFIDYSQWLLSGGSPYESNILCSESNLRSTGPDNTSQQMTTSTPNSDNNRKRNSKDCGTRGNNLLSWQTQTLPNQIASAETRIVRGQLLDTQPWTARNWIIRSLQMAGSIASAFTFATSSQSWIRGIGAFNGQGVTAAQTFWPDSTIGQMNRISDLGFQVNKVIAKQSSDIIVAFFPIERFITPGLKELFIKSPAVFFAPYVMTFDSEADASNTGSKKIASATNRLSDYIHKIFSDSELQNLTQHLYEVTSGKCAATSGETGGAADASLEKACHAADLINHLSLNTIRVLVGGTMTVDVDTVPANITSVEITTPPNRTSGSMWTAPLVPLTGVIRGSFLSNGTPVIVGADQLGIKVDPVADGSTDTQLNFKITLSKALPTSQTNLTFQVKKTKGGTTIQSTTYDYSISVSAAAEGSGTPEPKSKVAPASDKAKPGTKPAESKP